MTDTAEKDIATAQIKKTGFIYTFSVLLASVPQLTGHNPMGKIAFKHFVNGISLANLHIYKKMTLN